jgi:hypothetical protein
VVFEFIMERVWENCEIYAEKQATFSQILQIASHVSSTIVTKIPAQGANSDLRGLAKYDLFIFTVIANTRRIWIDVWSKVTQQD